MLQVDQKKFEEVLVKLNLISKTQLDQVKIESVRSSKDLDEALVDMKILDKEEVTKAKAISSGVPYVDLSSVKVDQNILKNISKEMAKKYKAVPFGFSGNMLNVAMTNPNNVQVIEFIERKSGFRVNPYMASEEGIERVVDQYQDLSSEVTEALKDVEVSKLQIKSGDESLKEISQDAPVTRAVNTILEYAAKSKASDIHVEPWENALKVRFRIDGILQETMSLPVHIQAALVSRIKILSNLKIDEHRIPQDGRFDVMVDDHDIDIRVSVSPTVHGEKVVMRLLDKSGGIIELNGLGLRGHSFRLIEKAIKQPHGMILSTGPTGSGKTTTLYAVLTELNSPGVNIVTLEDPVEYQVKGVNQIQINSQVGLTFASGLRSILRQDPDIIMVGEIRDSETADLAVQSALTGHTVLSTLHTNSAAGVLPRMLDMKIEPFLIASTVHTAMAQRLVRVLCPKCKKAYKASPALKEAIDKSVGKMLPGNEKEAKELGYPNVPKSGSADYTLYQAVGCSQCNNTGYSGRIGVYEVFKVSPEIEKLVVDHATTLEVHRQAVEEGMVTMRQDGFLKALEGITTIEEVAAKIAES
ncbi:MAG: ATPase, T2SS/T4P/T4SS family [Patescibacteria group bacterium]|nr:ATPase, T2SS/T4P/T4SS family [Patescibacteria group bacterium]